MRLKLALFGVVFAVLLGALLGANNRRKQTPTYLLSRYPPSENLGFIIADHSNPPAGDITLFKSDWFNGPSTQPNSACVVTTAGWSCTLSAGVPSGPSIGGELTKAQYAAFDKLAPTLPPSTATPPTLANLLVVSFRQSGSWVTRLYDRSNLPPAVVEAHHILGIKGFEKTSQ